MNETTERRVGERRGKGLSSDQGRNEFMYGFWNRFFHDRPEMDRRKQTERRGAIVSDSQQSSTELSQSPFASALRKIRSWIGSSR